MNVISLFSRDFIQAQSDLIKESYERVCGKPFPVVATSNQSLSEAMYFSEWVIVSHGTEQDPIFNYANRTAQLLWLMDWENFTKLPSRLSAKEDKTVKREAALKEALAKGFIDNYEGIRVDSKGKEFYIQDVTLWNLIDKEGVNRGQAAMFASWRHL